MNHKQDIYMSKDKIKKLKEEKEKEFEEAKKRREQFKLALSQIDEKLLMLRGEYKILKELLEEDGKKD